MVKICWVCDECNWLQVSDSLRRHELDNCKCGKCGVDLEKGYCRMLGYPRIIAKLKDNGKLIINSMEDKKMEEETQTEEPTTEEVEEDVEVEEELEVEED